MYRIIKYVFITIGILGIGVLFYNFQIIKIEGESMAPALDSGDYAIAKKKSNKDYEFNDILIFENDGKTLIKRVIATEGQKVELKDNTIYLDGVEFTGGNCNEPCKNDSYILNEDEYFLMGDNITISYDSRYFGPIKHDDIKFEIIYYGF